MNKFICFALSVCALASSVYCSGYSSYGSSASAPASLYNTNSYALGSGGISYDAAPAYPSSSSYSSPPSYGASPSYAAPSKPKYTVQPAYSQELYPGQNHYKAYNSPPVYSQVALPIIPADPVAKLYIPQQSYSSPNYGGSY